MTLNKIQNQIKSSIKKYSIVVMEILGSEEKPPLLHSIGAKLLGHPDLLLIGMSRHQGLYFLNLIMANLIEIGYTKNMIIHGLVKNNLPIALIKIDKTNKLYNEYVKQAGEYYGDKRQTFYQVVLSDVNGKFAWEHGYTEFLDGKQELLFTLDTDSLFSIEVVNFNCELRLQDSIENIYLSKH